MEELTSDLLLEISQELSHQDIRNLLIAYPHLATERFYEAFLQRKYQQGFTNNEEFWFEPFPINEKGYRLRFQKALTPRLVLRPGDTWRDVFENGLLATEDWEDYNMFLKNHVHEQYSDLPYKFWVVIEYTSEDRSQFRVLPVIARHHIEVPFQSGNYLKSGFTNNPEAIIADLRSTMQDGVSSYLSSFKKDEILKHEYIKFIDIHIILWSLLEDITNPYRRRHTRLILGPVGIGFPADQELTLDNQKLEY